MIPRQDQTFDNPGPGMIALLLILFMTLLALGDVSARAGRADAWAALCTTCDAAGTTTRTIPVSTGVRDDVSLSHH